MSYTRERPITSVDERGVGEVFADLGIVTHFGTVQRARLQLTTPAFPYLKAVG